ncbi:RRXRR domain-containing protein [Desulfobacter latus]|uniref:HNH endonuclease n=1 Tax=Desulfobacter latus TaxID=2292 RepID=A0A850T9C5_9BACT|nr:RRXRR domain-containing protein [Desulfobacter latus]NWH05118.1 HNH endonuclease [Desulfobacter latus]
MKVYVRSQSGKWLMPTNPANARILLKQGEAKVIQRTPFAIQLLYETTEHVQPVTVGIDDGGIQVGISAVSKGKSLFQQEITLRSDIKLKLDTRRQYRRSRRNRKTRYRKSRFLNRKSSIPICKVCGGNAPASQVICRVCLRKVKGIHQKYAGIPKKVFKIPPSIKAKKEAIIRAVKQIPLPVSRIILEDACFDFQAMENPDISGRQYQHGELLYHKNFKQACLVRDKFKCRVCGAESRLQCHHIKPKANGGTDKLSNLMTLCEGCHERHHKDGLKLPRQESTFYISAAHVQQGKNYLQAELSRIVPLRMTFGYITAHYRNKAGIQKSHVNDAVVIADKQADPLDRYIQTKHVQSRKRSLHEATARKGRKTPNRTQKRNNKNVFTLKGFSRWDTVQYKGKVGFISGFTGSSSCYIVDIKGNYIKNPMKKYKQVNLREVSLICKNQTIISQWVEKSPSESKIRKETSRPEN